MQNELDETVFEALDNALRDGFFLKSTAVDIAEDMVACGVFSPGEDRYTITEISNSVLKYLNDQTRDF